MELLIERRNKIAEELFEKHKATLEIRKENLTTDEKMKLVANYMPPEPELDSVVYYVNTGTKKSEGNSRKIVVNKETGEERFCATLISTEDLQENPNMTGQYNVERYLDAFNKRVKVLLVGFEPETAKNFLSKIVTVKTKIIVEEPIVEESVESKSDKPKKPKVKKPKTETVKEIKFEQADSALLNLELKNFDLNDFDESMYLEELEVNFWNKTGYDPRKIWNGFKMFNDNKIYYEIYDNALKYLNGLMIANNKSKIKSINDEHEKSDLILIKNGDEYNVGVFNGVFIEIIKENVVIPKGEIELEFDKKEEEKAKIFKEIELEQTEKNEEKKSLEILKNKRTKYFKRFKKRFKIAENITIEKLLKTDDAALDDLDLYIKQMEGMEEEEANEYLGFDIDSDDGTY